MVVDEFVFCPRVAEEEDICGAAASRTINSENRMRFFFIFYLLKVKLAPYAYRSDRPTAASGVSSFCIMPKNLTP